MHKYAREINVLILGMDPRTAPLSSRTIEVLTNLPFSEMADGAKVKIRAGQVLPITAMALGKGLYGQ